MIFGIVIVAIILYLLIFILAGADDKWRLPVHEYLLLALTGEAAIVVVIFLAVVLWKGVEAIFFG